MFERGIILEIKNLSQFKKAMKDGHTFEIVEHFVHPEYTGQVRCVQKLQTNGMYTGIAGQPRHQVSQLNFGKGCWTTFGKASDWVFENDLCKMSCRGKPVWTIRVL